MGRGYIYTICRELSLQTMGLWYNTSMLNTIRNLIAKSGLRGAEVARRSGIHPQVVNNIIRRKTRDITVPTLEGIVKGLGYSLVLVEDVSQPT